MGIQGLLPFLKEASEPIHIRKYKGYTVGIDTYCWIHRGAVGCATQLAKGDPADHYVRYCLKYVNMLRSLDIKPVMVFDGRNLPAKASVEESRRERRETYSRKGRQFLREGKASEARDCFVKCINVTPEMALDVMKAVRSLGVDCIVAPYEADAQLAYLEKNGFVQAVITEDSDLIAFGCKKVLVKLDLAGNCMEVDSSRLNVAMKIGEKFTAEKFRYMCIVAGCDYLASLPGIGIGKARKLFQLTANPDITQVIKRMATTLKTKKPVTPEYLEGFQQANNTFLYQLAFDPQKKKLQPLTPYTPEVSPSTLTYAGKYVAEDKAYQMALGNLNFNTMQSMTDFDPMVNKPYEKKTPRHLLSIWHKHYQPGPVLGCLDQNHIEREVTKGKEITVEVKQRLIQKKRQRDEEEQVAAPSDAQLSTMYNTKGHPDGSQWAESQRVIPETPDKDLEEIKPSKRNRFATKLQSKKRANIVNSGEVVTSRFFQPKKLDVSSEKKQQVSEDIKLKTEEKENHGVSLNTSGLLEGIVDIEIEQERQFKMENEDDDDVEMENIDDVIEMKSEGTVNGGQSRQTHVSKSLDLLQKFQRSSSGPMLTKTERDPSSSNSAKSRADSSLTSKSVDMTDSQKSVIEIESSQDSICSSKSIDTCSQSSALSSSQRQGTPRPRSAFSWSRKKELQGKNKPREGSKQSKLGTLSSFVFKPTNQSNAMPRQTSISGSQGSSLSRRDSLERPCSPISQDTSSQLLFLSRTSSIPGSMDMARLGEDITFIDSQNSSLSGSQDTSSINLTSDQPSQITDTTESSPPSPLPQLPHPSSSNPVDEMGSRQEEEEGERMEGMRRTGLSRKRKKMNSSKEESPSLIPSEVSSPDTDDVFLNSSTASSPSPPPASSSSSVHNTKLVGMTTVSQPNDSNDTDSRTVEGSRGAKKPFRSSSYFGGGERCQGDGARKKGVVQEEEEWENTPPGRGGLSPYKRQRNRSLSGKRHDQGLDAVFMNGEDHKKSISEPKKQSAFLGKIKASGLSKKRRSSGKGKPDTTPKGQTSLFAFMSKPKTKDQLMSQKGVSPLSPNRAYLCTDLTPETEGSLLSRQGRGLATKRHIFE